MKKLKQEFPECGDLDDMLSVTFKNGKEAMREAVVAKLRDMKGRALGKDRALLSEVIDIVRKMEVIP